MRKRTNKFILPIIIALGAYLVLDYANFPSLIGLLPQNINVAVFSVLFDISIVLILYVVSFFYIENKQNEKDANARDTVNILLEKTYQECLNNLTFLDNREMIAQYIIPKIDGDKAGSENKVVNNLQTLPFSSFDAVIGLATTGYVEKLQLNDYLDVKKEYQYLISVKITFFDLVKPETADQKALYHNIHSRDAALKLKLSKLLNI